MLKQSKKKAAEGNVDSPPAKKIKKSVKIEPNLEKPTKPKKVLKKPKKDSPKKEIEGSTELVSKPKASLKGKPDQGKFKSFNKDRNAKTKLEKPADWNEFKKKKKEVQKKRKESRNLYDVIVQAKKIGETLRQKNIKDDAERKRLSEELHTLLGGQKNYPKFVLAHDMARIVQYMLKFSSEKIRREIAQELIPSTVEMLQSKYGKFCVKNLFKYGDSKTRSEVIQACYGHAVKLASHAISSSIFDNGYTTWATTQQKHHLIQEFYGDMYKNSKDNSLTHVRDTYKSSPDMKTAILGSMKANLSRIMNKELLDSHIVQTVIMQYLQESNVEDRNELISQLANHIVVLSNSKEGSVAAMICFWYGTNKDRKTIVKTLKEHIINVCKHEYAHNTIIAILDTIDDTVLLNKVLLTEIISNANDLLNDEWGRKILLWLVAPGDNAYFHPTFIKELDAGREKSVSKKDVQLRRKEIISYCADGLLEKIVDDTDVWLKNASVAMVTFAILKTGAGKKLEEAHNKIAEIITNPDWKIIEGESETIGVEHAGFHMLMKKLLQHEKNNNTLFANALTEELSEKTIKKWIKNDGSCNRSCFLMVHIFENSSQETQDQLKEKIGKKCLSMLEEKKDKYKGASILLQKLK